MKAVIQAGGKGTRLKPYTLILPKPLMPVAEAPVIELLLRWLRRHGVDHVVITTGYLGHLLRLVCGDGSRWDMRIEYTEEVEPLGTLGALHLARDWLDEPFFVLNGDLITDLDLRAFMRFHRTHPEPLTIAVKETPVAVDMGVFEFDRDGLVTEFKEKPTLTYSANMGIYAMDPSIMDLIPTGVTFGFDDLMYLMLDEKIGARVFQHHGQFLDIGRPEDYARAQDRRRQ